MQRGLLTILVRLEGQSRAKQSEMNILEEVQTVAQLLAMAEQHFELDVGSITAVCWDDAQEPGLEIDRDREVLRLRDWDQISFKWSVAPAKIPKQRPWYVDVNRAFPKMNQIQHNVKEARSSGRNLFTKWSLKCPSDAAMSRVSDIGDAAWLTSFTPDELCKIAKRAP